MHDMKIIDRIRRRKPATELSDEVMAALEGCHIVLRPIGDEGTPRALVQVAGHPGGWIHSQAEDSRHLRSLFPGLSDAQVARAHRYIAAQVTRRVIASERRDVGRKTNYATEW